MGFNQLFNEYFDKEIDKDLLSIKKRIKPLTVIHINDLLYYSSLLQKLHIVIDDYHNYIDKKIAIDAMMSFSTYLETERFKGKKNFCKKTFDDFLKDSFLMEY